MTDEIHVINGKEYRKLRKGEIIEEGAMHSWCGRLIPITNDHGQAIGKTPLHFDPRRKFYNLIIEEGENDNKTRFEQKMSIIDFLHANKIEYFLMGSKRFGYDTALSDIDVGVWIPNTDDIRDMIRTLSAIRVNNDPQFSSIYGIRHTQLYSTRMSYIDVHILIFSDIVHYNVLKQEHEEVKDFLKENEILRHYIKVLKRNTPIAGSILYRILVKMINTIKTRKLITKGR